MNSIPIVTVNDLATDSFTTNKKGIDIKLSSTTSNGLKLTPDGLIYSARNGVSANPRVLLGAFFVGTFNDFNFNDELDINLKVESLGEDGEFVSYFGLNSQYELALSSHAHQDATTYDQEIGGVEYGTSFDSIYWGDESRQLTITYSVGGVTRTLMLSQVRLNNTCYVWCDIICVEPLNFIGLGSNNPSDGSITFNGKTYSDFYLDATYGSSLVAINAFDSDVGGYDYYLTRIGPNGRLETPLHSFPYADNVNGITQKYNCSANLLAVLYNGGSVLKVIAGIHVVDFNTGRESSRTAIDIYPDPNSIDMLIAVAFGDNDIVDIYRYNVDTGVIVKDSWFSVNFTTYQQGSSYYFIRALKVISDTRIGFALLLSLPDNVYNSKMMIVNTETGDIVVEQSMVDGNDRSGVENQNWLISLFLRHKLMTECRHYTCKKLLLKNH